VQPQQPNPSNQTSFMIPTFDQFLRPILALAAQGQVTRRGIQPLLAEQFKLTEEELLLRVPSGSSTLLANRSGWAMTFLTKAGLITKVSPKTYSATPAGHEMLKAYPSEISEDALKELPGWEDAWEAGRQRRRDRKKQPHQEALTNTTPEDAIGAGIKSLKDDLRYRLLAAILDQPPDFFERLVLQVLKAMGYGADDDDALRHVGQSGDEGIDGRINQDPLGLDQICVQAKRYAVDRPVDRVAIQAFIGSLAGHGVTKGIFITTSYFKGTAEEFVTRGSPTKIVLVDGEQLIDLMLRHRIGTRVKETYEVFEIDQNYFDEESESF
jgi:restriction system protein